MEIPGTSAVSSVLCLMSKPDGSFNTLLLSRTTQCSKSNTNLEFDIIPWLRSTLGYIFYSSRSMKWLTYVDHVVRNFNISIVHRDIPGAVNGKFCLNHPKLSRIYVSSVLTYIYISKIINTQKVIVKVNYFLGSEYRFSIWYDCIILF